MGFFTNLGSSFIFIVILVLLFVVVATWLGKKIIDKKFSIADVLTLLGVISIAWTIWMAYLAKWGLITRS